VDMTPWSCLAAVCLAAMAKIRSLLLIRKHSASSSASQWAIGLMLAYVVLGGSAVAYLRASIYQEVVFWAAAFGAVFVYFAVKGAVLRQYTGNTLAWMALMAGLALLTRVSTGIGMYLALVLLLIVLAVEEARTEPDGRQPLLSRIFHTLVSRRVLIPVGILAVLLIATGTVNFYRWGNPTTFADHRLYLLNAQYPDRMPRTRLYGYFNLARIPFGLGYFFLPLWVLRGGDGRLLFEGIQTRLMDAVELPPGSFFLTDLLPICFIVFLACALWSRRSQVLHPMSRWIALAAGLLAPCYLMITAISMNYRYRMEFYPEIDLLAFLGLYAVVSDGALLAGFNRRRRWMLASALVSVAAAFVAMILYKLSDFGPSQQLLRHGIVHYYVSAVQSIPWR
jgi:hypothetical protein